LGAGDAGAAGIGWGGAGRADQGFRAVVVERGVFEDAVEAVTLWP
jgi:hypothetical protein